MPLLESFSTSEVPPMRRLDYWNELTGSAFTPLVSDPLDRQAFVGPADAHPGRRHPPGRSPVGAGGRAPFPTTRGPRSRSAVPALPATRRVSVTRHQGRDSALRYGDFHLLDSSRPYELSFQQSNRMLVLAIPQHDLVRRMANPESVIGLPMSGRRRLARPAVLAAVRILGAALHGRVPVAALQRGAARSHRQRLRLGRRAREPTSHRSRSRGASKCVPTSSRICTIRP